MWISLSLSMRQKDGFANNLHAEHFANVGSLFGGLLIASLEPANCGMNRR